MTQWDGYTVFSVLSGVALVIMALIPTVVPRTRDRFWLFLGGAGLAIYGFYVANQTSGIYFFSVWIFVIPFVAVGYVILSAMERRSRAAGGATAAPRSSDYPASVPPKRQVQRAPAGRTQPPPVSRATTPPATRGIGSVGRNHDPLSCRGCGRSLRPQARFCPQCGVRAVHYPAGDPR
jgi:hypothetical protein